MPVKLADSTDLGPRVPLAGGWGGAVPLKVLVRVLACLCVCALSSGRRPDVGADSGGDGDVQSCPLLMGLESGSGTRELEPHETAAAQGSAASVLTGFPPARVPPGGAARRGWKLQPPTPAVGPSQRGPLGVTSPSTGWELGLVTGKHAACSSVHSPSPPRSPSHTWAACARTVSVLMAVEVGCPL